MSAVAQNQRPTFELKQPIKKSDIDLFLRLIDSLGLSVDEGQRYIAKHGLARKENGEWLYSRCVLLVPRQNGKTELVILRILYGLVILGEQIIYTSHELKSAMEIFSRLKEFFESNNFPELKEICRRIINTNGYQGIECEGYDEDAGKTIRSRVQFGARSRKSNRGYAGMSLIIIDEAQEYTSQQSAALRFALSASPLDRQLILLGTPPDRESQGDMLYNMRDIAKQGKDKRLYYAAGGVDEIGDVDDRKRGKRTNPALGIRLDMDTTADERADHIGREDVFARERLGWMPDKLELLDIPIKEKQGNECATKTPPKDGVTCYGVKFSTDGKEASISVCIKDAESDKRHIELVKYGKSETINGICDVLEPALNSTAQIIIDGRSKSEDLKQRLLELKAPAKAIGVSKTSDIIDASSMLESAVNQHEVTHYNQDSLNESATQCLRRPVGALGGGGGADTADVSAIIIESAALAYYASRKTKRNPDRKGRFY